MATCSISVCLGPAMTAARIVDVAVFARRDGLFASTCRPPSRLRSTHARGPECHRLPCRFVQPASEALQAFVHRNPLLPPGGALESPRVGHVVALVARSPSFKADLRLVSEQLLDQVDQLQETHGIARPASNVEGVTG